MFEPFFLSALAAGIGLSLVAGPLGCFIVWRRLAYFGDTLSHAALLGVAMGLLLNVNITLAVFVVSACVSVSLLFLQSRVGLSSDAILGLLSHSALALGLVVLSLMVWVRIDVMGLLFGDILSVNRTDLVLIWVGGAVLVGLLYWIWNPLFAGTVSRDLADAEGMAPDRAQFVFMMLMACVIAMAIKIVGVLLITALLIIPPATARRFSSGPEAMAVAAALIGAVSVVAGLFGSLIWDTPSGPSIVVAAACLFLFGQIVASVKSKLSA
ncbi:MAG: metal ABC transporter permease [Pseudomonadota bacterium]